jgi:oligo-1,6-glucosidase
MYASPQVDMGYDISDYNAIYPPYGTMSDMDALITGLHSRNMKLILDLVINHTSDQHAWFQSSKKSRTGKHSDWYIWRDPKYTTDPHTGKKTRAPPNNWGASFGGSAWEYVPARDQYYLHLFAVEQPDLNWECVATRQAIYDSALRFWFEKGIDGFRIDTANLYSKVQTFPDGKVVKGNKMYPYAEAHDFVANGPRIHEFYREIRGQVLDDFGDPMMIGELGGCTKEELMRYIGRDRREISMVFDFDFAAVGLMFGKPWHEISGRGFTLPEMKAALLKTQDLVADPQGWSSMFGENHDLARSVDRFGDAGTKYREKSCKVLAMMLGTLSGTLFIYQGQEIGMTNVPKTWGIEDMKDLNSINYYEKVKREHPGDKEILRKAWEGIVKYGRDNARTPVQWDGSAEFAGFSEKRPWMRVNDNYKEINVADQLQHKHSVRSFWKRIISLRKEHADLFIHGTYVVHDEEDLNTFTFEKTSANGRKALVMLNFSDEEQEFKVPKSFEGKGMKCLISNEEKPGAKLGPWEGRVYVEIED